MEFLGHVWYMYLLCFENVTFFFFLKKTHLWEVFFWLLLNLMEEVVVVRGLHLFLALEKLLCLLLWREGPSLARGF